MRGGGTYLPLRVKSHPLQALLTPYLDGYRFSARCSSHASTLEVAFRRDQYRVLVATHDQHLITCHSADYYCFGIANPEELYKINLHLKNSLMHSLIDSLFHFFSTIDYTAIFILMTLESSIFPVPSELVMIPAGVSALGGHIDPVLATLVGGIGSVVGALLNYYILGKWLGKPFLEKYGQYILITREKYQKSENLFLQNDRVYTFV